MFYSFSVDGVSYGVEGEKQIAAIQELCDFLEDQEINWENIEFEFECVEVPEFFQKIYLYDVYKYY